jgi:predicted double-glycine peptidase
VRSFFSHFGSIRKLILAGFLLLLQISSVYAEGVLATPTLISRVPLKSWKTLRDQHLVKQNFDYSCGAASLATILRFYGKNVTELQIMQAMGREDGIASFEDMAKVLPKFGFKGQGIALSFEQLTHLKVPVVAYLSPEREDHFTVIRGISKDYVWIGDPSWGNRILTRARFLKMWQTRADSNLAGKILVILPQGPQQLAKWAFETPEPHSLPIQLILHRKYERVY